MTPSESAWLSQFVADCGKFTGKFVINFFFTLALFSFWAWLGIPESLDFPTPTTKQLIGITLIFAYAVSAGKDS